MVMQVRYCEHAIAQLLALLVAIKARLIISIFVPTGPFSFSWSLCMENPSPSEKDLRLESCQDGTGMAQVTEQA